MSIHPETAAFAIAAGMVDMCRRAATFAADRADQASLDAWAYPRESQEMVFDAHDRAFAFFKGACTRGIYDNMKTVKRHASVTPLDTIKA